MKTPEEIAMIIDNAKRIGCHSVTIDNIIYQFHDHMTVEQKINPSIPDALKAEDIMKPMTEEITEDELKYWATPYYDVLQQEKELRAQQLKDKADANG